MSYIVNSPCYNCSKSGKCTDEKHIKEAVTKIHETSFDNGHQGCGQIVIACVTQNK